MATISQASDFYSDPVQKSQMSHFAALLPPGREGKNILSIYLDFRGKKLVVSNEFYPPTGYDASLSWVSWGKKNSVIAFEDGSRFRYENGHVTMINEGSAAKDGH